MGELHPSKTAKQGHLPSDDVITKGKNADRGGFAATKDVYCQQCGFPCNLERDIRNVNQFAGETITQANELSNGSFENWTAGSPNSWTVSGTVTQTTTDGYFDKSDDGASSAQVARSSSDILLEQSMATPSDFNNNTIIFRVRVKCSSNGVIRLRVLINNTLSYYSSYNTAQVNFQELYILVECPTTVSSLTVYILADNTNGTAYIDQAILARSGNPTTVAVNSGCPMCGSFNYY